MKYKKKKRKNNQIKLGWFKIIFNVTTMSSHELSLENKY